MYKYIIPILLVLSVNGNAEPLLDTFNDVERNIADIHQQLVDDYKEQSRTDLLIALTEANEALESTKKVISIIKQVKAETIDIPSNPTEEQLKYYIAKGVTKFDDYFLLLHRIGDANRDAIEMQQTITAYTNNLQKEALKEQEKQMIKQYEQSIKEKFL